MSHNLMPTEIAQQGIGQVTTQSELFCTRCQNRFKVAKLPRVVLDKDINRFVADFFDVQTLCQNNVATLLTKPRKISLKM
jgi:hypothetical protein